MLSTYPRRPTAEALMQHRGSSRTSSRSDRSKHRYSGTSEFLAHVQLDDAPRAPIQQSFGDEFRQHNGVVTMMMFYRCRASPKHRYDMTEVDYGGGGHRTRLKDQLINLRVHGVPPSPIYKGVEDGEPALYYGVPWGVLLPPGVGFPPSM